MGWKPEETLCLSCSRATKSDCAWSAIGEPVNGWKAEPTPRGYRVIECPRYDSDVYYCSDGTQKLDRSKHRDIDNDGMISLSDITNVNRINYRSNTWKPHTALLK